MNVDAYWVNIQNIDYRLIVNQFQWIKKFDYQFFWVDADLA